MKRAMSIKGPALLLATGIVTAEFFCSAPGSAHMPVLSRATTAQNSAPRSVEPTNPELAANDIVTRPMFSSVRKGSVVKDPGETVAVAPSDLPRLAGMMIGGSIKLAMFQSKDAPKPMTVSVGGTVAGWTVAGVTTTSVTLTRDGDTQILHPTAIPFVDQTPAPPQIADTGMSPVPLHGG